MKKIITLGVALLTLFAINSQGQNAWINEIHYDNVGTDTNEMIEVIVENPGSYNLSLFQVDLYNGNSGTIYRTNTLDEFTVGNTVGNSTLYYFMYPVNGIQNGPDGMALSYDGSLISGQFLSWEGTFNGVGGPADGVTSVDIGVAESNSTTLDTESLQLTGSGTQYSSFSWAGPITSNTGALNTGQSLSGAPLPEPTNYPTAFIATASGNMIELIWTDATGVQLPGAYIIFISDQYNIVAPVDGTPVADDLDLSDGEGARNVNYTHEAYTFTGLETNTLYYFAIYPYTNTGATIDYKTDGMEPEATASTANVVMFENFDWSWMTWTAISVTGDQLWDRNNTNGPDNTPCAHMNGYSGGSNENEDWLISPPINLDMYTNEKLTFYTARNNTGPELEVKYSNDYDGNGNPFTSTWTTISATLPTGSWVWTASGDVDLSGISGTAVYLAFIYTSTASNSATWEVDNVLLTGDGPDPADIVINEIMYNSPGDDEEWIELYNNTSVAVDLSGWFIQDNNYNSIPIAIPGGTSLAAGDYYTIAVATNGNFPFTPDLDGTTQANWTLGNGFDDVNLFNLGRLHTDHVPYMDISPWPTGPAGNGPTLSLLDPDFDNALPTSWETSTQNGGTPGVENFPLQPIINVSSPSGGESWEQGSVHEITWNTVVYAGNIKIELIDTNTWTLQLLVSNIASSLNTWTWNIMSGQAIGDDYIIRISDLSSGLIGESANTFSIVEPYFQLEIVITEIMCNPPESGSDSLEFIELYNNGADPVDLTGFEFTNGVSWLFPAIILNPAEFMVVAVDSIAMMNTFGTLTYQWSSGALSNSGEHILLVDNNDFFVDSVRYDDHLPWDTLADGFGPSLTLCDPDLDNGLAESWAASIEFAAINTVGDSIWATPLAGCSVILPTASFKASDTTVLVGSTTDFSNLSTGGTMVAWIWTFEGGTPGTSNEQNPASIQYDAQGTYDVTLEVENDYGLTSSLTIVDYISVDFAPVADFEADATNPAVGQEVNFTDLSTGTVTGWAWEFESGTPATSMLQTPEPIVYAIVGVYDVQLTVSNDYGDNTMLKADYIDVHSIGISEMLNDDMIRIYPNPASGRLNIENTSGEEIILSIYTLTGQKILENRIQEGTEIINLESLDSGIYFVRYLTENHLVKTGKLIII
jgi:PKD repeat protein